MSVSHPDNLSYRLGEEALSWDYDEQADILYLWRGEDAAEGISLTSDEGHIARFDPISGEIVGVTIFDFCRRWQGPDEEVTNILVTLPRIAFSDDAVAEAKQLELVPA